MLQNYFKTAFRNLLRHPGFSGISIIGLAVGLAAFLLIALWIQDELGYDRFHENADRIFRVVRADANGEAGFARTPPLTAPTLRQHFPQVEQAIRLKRAGFAVKVENQVIQEDQFFFAEPAVFDVFTLPMLQGDVKTALSQPYSVVLTQEMARKYFGSSDPLGQIITIRDSTELTVTGIIADLPPNSHIEIDFLASWKTWTTFVEQRWLETWRSGIYYTYVLLKDGYAAEALEENFAGANFRTDFGSKAQILIRLQPLKGIHFHSHLQHELQANGNVLYVYLFAAIAVFVLLIACINFMNLATARSTRRMREVGMRKVLGAFRKQLVGQFIGEAMIVSTLALLLALLLVEVSLPSFNSFAGKELTLFSNDIMLIIGGLVLLVILVGLLSGSYPAFFLSSFQPIRILKGKSDSPRSGVAVLLRKGLIVFQFAISITLIIATLVVYNQLDFVKNQDLGFNKEQIVVIPFQWDSRVQSHYQSFKEQLLAQPTVIDVTASGDVPGRMMTAMTYKVEGMGEDEWGGITALIVDPDFAETYEVSMAAGRDFSDEMQTDVSNAFIINEAAAAEMGFTAEEAIGKRFRMNEDGQIIGVMKDFNFNSLHKGIDPLVLAVWPSWFGYVSVRIAPGNISESLANLREIWLSNHPNRPFNYFFFDDHFDQLYRADEQFGQVFIGFAVLAIFIACLGLLGLAAFTAEQRTKEIGVRKVLGASVADVATELSKNFVKLVLLANIIAWPAAWFAMDKWLANFAYRTEIGWPVFIFAGSLALLIAVVTVSTQAIKAALANPIHALRSE